MNKKEATQVLALLRAAYPTDYMNMTAEEAQGVVSMWSMQFADISVDIVLMALNKLVSTKRKSPTIADVKEKLKSIHWEAYEAIQQNYISHNLHQNELNTYKRIYDETQGYKFANRVEPTISSMLTGGNGMKQIGERGE